MAYRSEIAPQALAQALETFDWIASDSPERAERWLVGFFEHVESLHDMPLRCPVAVDITAIGKVVRELHYGGRRALHRILFTIQGDLVRVEAVWHSARGEIGL